MFVCERCGNKDPRYVGYLNGKPYCRRCISMRGEEAKPHTPKGSSAVIKLDYELSKEQSFVSEKVLENYKNGIDTLINAVCGAGKTELVYRVMAHALSKKQNVAFAIPRRDVVVELMMRIKSAFPYNSVTAVFGGNTNKLEADIVVLTTHQLYRYPDYFDLIILDEIDAFPFKNSNLLDSMFFRALKGHFVMMSATPSQEVIKEFSKPGKDIVELNVRFHRHQLPVPKLHVLIGYTKYLFLIKKLKEYSRENKPCFVFAPTIEKCEKIFNKIKVFAKGGNYVHSKCKNRQEIIADFKNGKYKYLVTTAVLERGVTIKNLQIIVFDADNRIYDEFALIQISGRVGRKFDAPEGEAIFLANKTTKSIEKSIETIREKNQSL